MNGVVLDEVAESAGIIDRHSAVDVTNGSARDHGATTLWQKPDADKHSAVDVTNGSARDHGATTLWQKPDADKLSTYSAGDRSMLLRAHAAKSAECGGHPQSHGSPRARRPPRESRRVSLAQAPGYVQLNQYRLLEPIGQGSYGIVKLAYNEEDDTHYAMKILSKRKLMRRAGLFGRAPPKRQGPGPPPDPLQRVYREIAVLKKLDHPNVVKLVEVLDDPAEDHLYLVFQLLEGGPVVDIPSESPLSEPIARKYFRDVLLGVEYLHYQRIAHRDLKPANLLLGEGRVQVADLGACGELVPAGRLSGAVGTPAFRAPEAAAPADKYSGEAADIWSLGVTLYSMVTGRVPWVGSSSVDLQQKVLSEPLTFPPRLQLSKEFKQLLSRMLDKDPATRATMQEIKEHEWVTAGGKDPLPSEQENCRLVEITEEDMAQVVTSIPNLSTLILIKTMLKKHSFQNPFLRSREGSTSRRESAVKAEHCEQAGPTVRRGTLARAGRSLSAPGNYLTERQASFDIALESVQETRDTPGERPSETPRNVTTPSNGQEHSNSETPRNSSENSRSSSGTSRNCSESPRYSSEASTTSLESPRNYLESPRSSSESQRCTSESSHISLETPRNGSETSSNSTAVERNAHVPR